MIPFPALVPSAAPITYGVWASATHKAMNGGTSTVRLSNTETGREWAPTFENITEQEYLYIVHHYQGSRSGFDVFPFDAITLAPALTPSGMGWQHAAPPAVVDRHADVFTVACKFVCVPIRAVRIPGRSLLTGATTLAPGAWSVT